jgi:hypothetical protein
MKLGFPKAFLLSLIMPTGPRLLGNLGVGFSVGFQNESVDGTQWYIPSLMGLVVVLMDRLKMELYPKVKQASWPLMQVLAYCLLEELLCGVSVTHLNQASITFETRRELFWPALLFVRRRQYRNG